MLCVNLNGNVIYLRKLQILSPDIVMSGFGIFYLKNL